MHVVRIIRRKQNTERLKMIRQTLRDGRTQNNSCIGKDGRKSLIDSKIQGI